MGKRPLKSEFQLGHLVEPHQPPSFPSTTSAEHPSYQLIPFHSQLVGEVNDVIHGLIEVIVNEVVPISGEIPPKDSDFHVQLERTIVLVDVKLARPHLLVILMQTLFNILFVAGFES